MASLGPAAKVQTTPMRLRESHYSVIRMAALGHTNNEIASATGYSRERIGQILNSPASQAVLENIRDKIEQGIADEAIAAETVALRTKKVAETQRLDYLLEEEAEGRYVAIRDLNAIIADIEDRYGTPRKSTNVNLSANFGSDLEKAIARSEGVEAVRGATLPERLP